MELNQLKSFFEAARCGNLSSAAQKLHASQPAISRQISALEKEYGLSLFSRHSRGVKLTEAGRCLFQYVEKALLQLDKAEKALAGIHDLESGLISVGASTTIGNYLLPGWLAIFSKQYSKIDVSLQVENSHHIILNVIEGKLDIGLIAGPVNSPELCQEYMMDDEIILLVDSKHHWIMEEPFFPEALNEACLILREPGSATREAIETFLEKNGIKPLKTIILGDTEAIKRAVMAGMGITFLSKSTVLMELRYNLLYEIKDRSLCIKRPLIAVYLKGNRPSPALLAFLSIIKQFLGHN